MTAGQMDFENYELKIAAIAEANCKSRVEWRKAEADDIRRRATGKMRQKSAGELLEGYREKLQRVYRISGWYDGQIKDCNEQIIELEKQMANVNSGRKRNRIRNKLKHWRGVLVELQYKLSRQEQREKRYEQLVMKWLGIMEKIKIAETAQEIHLEKSGIDNSNKYGFNPKAQSRETAEIMFRD
jgi:hypothetical protein